MEQFEQLVLDGDLAAVELAIEQFEQAGELTDCYDAATICMTYGLVPQAKALYEKLQQALPKESQLIIDRAMACLELGEEDEAVSLLHEVEEEDPNYPQALLVLADYYQMIGLTETAIAKVEEAKHYLPNEPIVQFAYAELLLQTGRYAEAVAYYKDLASQMEFVGEVRLIARLAEAYRMGAAYEEALPYYEQLVQDERTPQVLYDLAATHFQLEQPLQTITLTTELIEADPDFYAAYLLKGHALEAQEELTEAFEIYEAGLKRDEYNKVLHVAMARLAIKIQRPEQAETHLLEALALDPEYVDAFITLGFMYATEQRDEALIELLESTEEFHVPLSYLGAEAYARLERYEEAHSLYEQAESDLLEDPLFLSSYATFLIEEGNVTKAYELVKRYLAIHPDAEWEQWVQRYEEEQYGNNGFNSL